MKSDMIKNLEERSLSLRKAVDKAKRCLGKAPEGHLQYSTSKRTNTIQYFHRTDPKKHAWKVYPRIQTQARCFSRSERLYEKAPSSCSKRTDTD